METSMETIYQKMETLIVFLLRINRDQLTNPTQVLEYQFETICFDKIVTKKVKIENGIL